MQPPTWNYPEPGQRIRASLRAWAQSCKLPVVLLIDEIDSLENETLISFLRQLREGYRGRPKNFPQSIGLIGLRDVRDYKYASGGIAVDGFPGIKQLPWGSERLNTSSPFNIKVGSFTLRNFNAAEVTELYQHYYQQY